MASLLLAASQSLIGQNPFDTRAGGGQPAERSSQIYRGNAPAFILEWSNRLQSGIAALSGAVRDRADLLAAGGAFLLAILFGIVHIAGPGHGKAFALSYFASRKARIRHAVAYSAVVNVVDSLSAFVVVFLGYVILRFTLPTFRGDAPRILQIISYAVIIAFGVGQLVHALSHHLGHREHGHGDGDARPGDGNARPGDDHDGHRHDDARHDHRDASASQPNRLAKPWMLGLSVGLVPCPVSTVLLVYGLANDVLGLMAVLVLGVSIGGFLTMLAISTAVVVGRSALISRMTDGAAGSAAVVLEYGSSVAIVAIGLLLLIAIL